VELKSAVGLFSMREHLLLYGFTGRALSWVLPFLVISAAYLYAFPQPTVFYAGVVLLHAFGGVAAAILLVPGLIRVLRIGSFVARAGPARRGRSGTGFTCILRSP